MRGRKLAFPKKRRIVLDILAAAKTVPAFPLDRWLDLSEIAAARSESAIRISWTAIFVRGWGLASQQIPELRQTYISFPWGYIYEHPNSVVSISVHRREPNSRSDQLIFCQVVNAEAIQLTDIQDRLNRSQREPIETVFSDGYRLSRMPWLFRRLVWTLLMRVWGKKKSKTIGTFTVSSLAGQNASNRQHPLIATTSLSFSPLDEKGKCLLTLLCDHRVIDGYKATEGLDQLEHFLKTSILSELRSLARTPNLQRPDPQQIDL